MTANRHFSLAKLNEAITDIVNAHAKLDLSRAQVSPYLTESINRFGQYATHELDAEPEAYEPHLDVDFTKLGEADTEQAA